LETLGLASTVNLVVEPKGQPKERQRNSDDDVAAAAHFFHLHTFRSDSRQLSTILSFLRIGGYRNFCTVHK